MKILAVGVLCSLLLASVPAPAFAQSSDQQSLQQMASLLSSLQNIINKLKQQISTHFNAYPGVSTASAQTADITTGLVGHWKFDEGSGTTATDASGNNNTGTLTNGPTWTTGKMGGAINLDGTNDYVDAGSAASLDNLPAVAISMWVYPRTHGASSYGRFIAKGSYLTPATDGWTFGFQGSPGYIGFVVPHNGTSLEATSVQNPVALNQWQHIVVTWDGSLTGTNAKIYRDGVEVGYYSRTNGSGIRQDDSFRNLIIGDNNNHNAQFNGLMDDVRVYNRALSASDIQALYNLGSSTPPPPPPSGDTQPPTTPTNLSASAISSSQVNLSWTPSTDNIGVTGYRVERCQGSGCTSFVQITLSTSSGQATQTYSDTGLFANTTYRYQVRAADAAGNLSPYSSIASATTQSAPTGGTALGNLAASMAPGTWAVLNTNGDASGFGEALLDDGGGHHILEYSDKATWDSVSRSFFFYGSGHYQTSKFIRYSDAANTWSTLPLSPTTAGPLYGHAYQHDALDPLGRTFYYREYGSRTIAKYNIDTATWSTLPNNNLIDYVQCCGAIEYFPEMGGLVFVSGGETLQGGGVFFFNTSTNQWTRLGQDLPMGNLQNFAVYNPVHKVILFGGGSGTRNIYKLSSSGVITNLQQAPIGLNITSTIITVDPVSGKYLIFADGNLFYEYDILTDTWRQLNSSTVPIYGGGGSSTPGNVFGKVATPINAYGVVMIVKFDWAQSKVYLYKHTAGGGAPPPSDTQAPSTPTGLSATAISSSQINLSWTTSTDNVGVTGYRVERCQGAGCTTFTQIATLALTSYSDTGLTANTSYTYRVRATDAAGNLSGYSSVASATTQSAPTGGTALGNLAASMAPGEWQELATNNINAVLANVPNGSSNFIFGFTDSIKWDSVSKRLFYIGGDHDFSNVFPGRFVTYHESTNTWQTLSTPSFANSGFAHGYDHMGIDPQNGYFYTRKQATREVFRYNIAAGTWTNIPNIPSNVMSWVACCTGVEWFPERQSLVYASLESGSNGSIVEYHTPSGQWRRIHPTANLPMGSIHNFAEYNPVHKVIFFGGGDNNTNKIYKLDAAGTITTLSNPPISLRIQSSVVTVDPVSGDYLILTSSQQFYKYNVVTDVWTTLPNPPANVWSNFSPPIHGLVATPVSSHNIVLVVSCRDSSGNNCHVWLYKHAAASSPSPDTTPPSNPTNISATAVSSSQINLSWTASTDNIGVTGYRVYRGGTQITTVTGTSYSDTGLSPSTTYSYTVAAYDAAGNVSVQSSAASATTQASAPPPTGGTFAEKCARAGVLNCFDFDSPSQLLYTWPTGTVCDAAMAGKTRYSITGWRAPGEGNAAATIQNGQCVFPEVDTSVKNSGNGSIKFTIPSQSGSNSSGFFTDHFKRYADTSVAYIAPGSPLGNVVYWQFYQKFDPNFLSTRYQCGTDGTESCGGWKQIIWYGNAPNGSSASSIEITHNNGWQRGVPTMYGQIGQDDYGVQDAAGCSYNFNGQNTYPEPPCVRYKSDQWMEFTVRVEVRGSPNAAQSRVQMWVDGKLAIDNPNAKVNWGSSDGDGLGQFQITPYHTRKYAGQVHPTGYTWFDDVIISTQPIAMRTGSTPLLGDLNNDRTVNNFDWNIMAGVWFTNDPIADINKDGIVNTADFYFIYTNWGRTI